MVLEAGPWMGLVGLASGIVWGLISMYFKQIELQKTARRDKEDCDRSINGIGNKVRRLETAMMNDRCVDIAATKEEPLRLWKAGLFKEETKQ